MAADRRHARACSIGARAFEQMAAGGRKLVTWTRGRGTSSKGKDLSRRFKPAGPASKVL